MRDLWRIKDVLAWTTRYFRDRGIEEARLEADLLLARVLQKDRVYLYANYERPLDKKEREEYKDFIRRRIKGEPAAYILGYKEFMSLSFQVNPAVLIPRPDTETLVETALSLAREHSITSICDVGTGSGIIAISLAVYLPDARVYAVDISESALDLAAENARQHNVELHLYQSDLLEDYQGERPVDLITANLPYVPEAEWLHLEESVRDFEPRQALIGGGDKGLDLYARFIPQAEKLLRPGGIILMEIDPRQSEAAGRMMAGFTDLRIIKDWAGRDRVIQGRRSL